MKIEEACGTIVIATASVGTALRFILREFAELRTAWRETLRKR